MQNSLPLDYDERDEKAAIYAVHVTRFTYVMLVLAYFNSLARADHTASVCVIGLISLWFKRKDVALVYFYTLAFSFVLDLTWVSIHGQYLRDYGKIPNEASGSIRSVIHLHKFSLAISIVQLLFKFVSLFYVYRFWYFLRRDSGQIDMDVEQGVEQGKQK